MSEHPRSKVKTAVFAVVTPILALGLLVLVLEGVLRIGRYNPLASFQPSSDQKFYLRQSADPILRYELNPGYRGRVLKAHIRINSRGFRGREFARDKKGGLRIALLGDSITFAKGYEETEIFASRLERALHRADPRIEVMNLAVDGYDTLQEVEALKRIGLPLAPDWVVVCYCLNDIAVTPLDLGFMGLYMKPRLPMAYHLRLFQWVSLTFRKIGLQRELKRRLESGTGFDEAYGGLVPAAEKDAFLDERFGEIEDAQRSFSSAGGDRKRAVADQKGRLWLNQYTSLRNIGKIRYAFGELQTLARENGFKVLVAVIPFFYTVEGAYLDRPAHAIVLREAERCGFEAVDLLGDFEPGGLQNYTIDGVHLNNPGHELMTEALHREIGRRLGLKDLPGTPMGKGR